MTDSTEPVFEPEGSPWQPEGTEVVLVLHRYNIPLVGIVHHSTGDWLYQSILGQDGDSQVWAYTPLDSFQSSLFTTEFFSREYFDQLLDEYAASASWLAIATFTAEGPRIQDSIPISGLQFSKENNNG